MKRPGFVAGLVAAGLLGMPTVLSAQWWPGNPYAGYGAWGGYPYGQYGTERTIAAQNRQLGQVAAMGQNAVVQSGIRNTLMSQAQTQTNSILNQQQANQDWWFQQQTQQMAQDRARAYSAPRPAAAGAAFEPGVRAVAPPPAATDVIKWPPLLQERAFAYTRAQIEAPYRRSPPGLSTPTADDYRAMVKVVEQMKATLEWLTKEGVDLDDYNEADAFLNKLGQEASQRSEPGSPPARP